MTMTEEAKSQCAEQNKTLSSYSSLSCNKVKSTPKYLYALTMTMTMHCIMEFGSDALLWNEGNPFSTQQRGVQNKKYYFLNSILALKMI